jgi:hypothetical protein
MAALIQFDPSSHTVLSLHFAAVLNSVGALYNTTNRRFVLVADQNKESARAYY